MDFLFHLVNGREVEFGDGCAERPGICSDGLLREHSKLHARHRHRMLHRYANAKPDFKPGDALTAKDIERMRPLTKISILILQTHSF
jgi:hypothetical protein